MSETMYHKYTEIENMTPKWIQQVRDHGFDKSCAEWYAAVKIDGCNLQLYVDAEGTMHYGSRNQELGRYDTFNNYRSMVARLQLDEKVQQAKAYWCEEMNKGIKDMILVGTRMYPVTFCVYGELCGGVYRHPDVEPVKGESKIQGRVCYAPDHRWVVFDIWVLIHTFPEPTGFYLTPSEVHEICAQVGLPSQQIVCCGTFDEVIAYPNDFEDETGHVLFGLPKLEKNIVEGVVIKPGRELRFGNGDRVIAKNKNQIFLERGVKTNKIKNPPEPMTDLDMEWFGIYMSFVTESRMMSVLSKMDTSNITQRDFGKLLNAFIDDADKDFNKEYGGQIKVLEAEKPVSEFNFMKVLKAAKGEAAKLIRPHFLEYLQNQKG